MLRPFSKCTMTKRRRSLSGLTSTSAPRCLLSGSWRRVIDQHTLCSPADGTSTSARHFMVLDVENQDPSIEGLLPLTWLAWAYIFGQYSGTEPFLTIVPVTTPNESENTPNAQKHITCVQIALGEVKAIQKALGRLQDGLNGRQRCQSSRSYELYISSEMPSDYCSTKLRTNPICLISLVSSQRIHFKVDIDDSFANQQQCYRIKSQFLSTFHQLLQRGPTWGFQDLRQMTHEDIDDLRRWNGYVPLHEPSCVDHMIRRRTQDQPSMHAVCAPDGNLSYSELDELSSSLATVLIKHGVVADSFVPICFEKSMYVVVAVVAVCKAGGAFVLLDPNQPLQRLKSIVDQAQARICLVSKKQSTAWMSASDMSSHQKLTITKSFLASLTRQSVTVPSLAKPNSACYVVFSSGSTGQPKGVVIEHRNLLTFSREFRKQLRLTARPRQSRLLQFSSFAFDASVIEILISLLAGACICMPSEEQRVNDLAGAMNELRIDTAILTPTVLKTLSPAKVPGLRTLIAVGEAVTSTFIREWADAVQLVISYGPCECTAGSIAKTNVTRDTPSAMIGRADSCVAWVANPSDSDVLAPIGAVGELFIEGPLLGRGYLNDPDKTKAAFIEDPAWIRDFRFVKGNRFYKTGDLVKYASDGSLLFVGRKDTQVKVRGQRVELSEVRLQLLSAHTDIIDAVVDVIVPAGTRKDPLLVAFIILRGETTFSKPELRGILDELENTMLTRVPKYMVPSAFLQLPSIPVSPSGKIDRRKLREMASSKSAQELMSDDRKNWIRSELTSNEMVVSQLWSKILGLNEEDIPQNVSFFRLGGDSIRAMELSNDARSAGWRLTVPEIFMNPSVSEMAHVITRLSQSHESIHANSSFTTSRKPTMHEALAANGSSYDHCIPATNVQEDALTQAMLLSRGALLYMSFRLQGSLNVEKLRLACFQLVHKHEILRTSFFLQIGQLMQVVPRRFQLQFEIRQLDNEAYESAEALSELYRADSTACNVLGRPVLKFILLQHHSSEYRLVLRVSHATIDGISMQRLCDDLSNAYLGIERPPGPSFHGYLDVIAQHHTEKAYAYWRQMLENSTMTEIVSRTVPDYLYHANCVLSRSITIKSIDVDGVDITPAMIVKAAWALVLFQLTGEPDVIFGSLGSGRNVHMYGIENVVGPCITDVPMRIRYDASLGVGDFLIAIRDQFLRSLSFETIGFQEIVRRCTNWTRWTRLSSYVQFQNVQPRQRFQIGENLSCELEEHETPSDSADLYILATPRGNSLDINLSFSSDVIPNSLGQYALDRLCHYIQALSNVSSSLDTLFDNISQGPILPVKRPPMGPSFKRDNNFNLSPSDFPIQKLRDLEEAWEEALGSKFTFRTIRDLEQNFFNVGGDFPRLVYLATTLQKQGYAVEISQLMYHPMANMQLALLVQ